MVRAEFPGNVTFEQRPREEDFSRGCVASWSREWSVLKPFSGESARARVSSLPVAGAGGVGSEDEPVKWSRQSSLGSQHRVRAGFFFGSWVISIALTLLL